MAVKKICVIGIGKAGVPLGVIIAYKCPEIRVTIVQTSPDNVFQWNSGRVPDPVFVPGLEEYLRKCQNKNLSFITNDGIAIKEADIIFILSESRLKTRGEGEKRVTDLSSIEGVAHLIAEHADGSKIVVENSAIPLRAAECLRNVFKYNRKPGEEFQVLSNPEFYTHGSPLRNLLCPEWVLIGSDNTPEGLAAARQLTSIYERWVPNDKILTSSNWSVEMSKICVSAMLAQALGSMHAFAAVCEEAGGNALAVMKALPENAHEYRYKYHEDKFTMSVGNNSAVLHNLLYICDWTGLKEVGDYWRAVLDMYTMHQERFLKKFTFILNHTSNKRIALLGFAYYKDTQTTEGAEALHLGKIFLEDHCSISIYDPKVEKQQVLEDLWSVGCQLSKESMEKLVSVHEDPYEAVCNSQVVVVCQSWFDFTHLDYDRIYSEMEKPAYMFDRGFLLPHKKLEDIGFVVHAVGTTPACYRDTD